MHRVNGCPQQDHAASPVIGTVISEFCDDAGTYLVLRLPEPLPHGTRAGDKVSVAHHARQAHPQPHLVATSLGLQLDGKHGRVIDTECDHHTFSSVTNWLQRHGF